MFILDGHCLQGRKRQIAELPGHPGAVWGGLLCSCCTHLVSLPVAEAYVGGMLFCLGIFLSFYLLTVLLACWENWR